MMNMTDAWYPIFTIIKTSVQLTSAVSGISTVSLKAREQSRDVIPKATD